MSLVRVAPSVESKLAVLAQAARHDLACACGQGQTRKRGTDGLWIYPAALPSGERVPLLKVLQASGCERGCLYCAERLGGQSAPVSLLPDDLARVFFELYQRRKVLGLFLSSAIQKGSIATMDQMLATADILRKQYRFRGYIHLKIIPGSSPNQVEKAMALATRVSVNLEAPSAMHLQRIAPHKQFHRELIAPMRQVAQSVANGRFARSGQTSQLVVGAAGESDRQIMTTANWLYKSLSLARVYYSSLQPVSGTGFQLSRPVSFLREHRLYQVDFLLRSYGFQLEEIQFDQEGALAIGLDPKSAWAQKHPECFPMEINTASEGELLRIPGIGPKSARRIVRQRSKERFRSIESLGALGISWRVAAPFVLVDGRPGIKKQMRQMSLFPNL